MSPHCDHHQRHHQNQHVQQLMLSSGVEFAFLLRRISFLVCCSSSSVVCAAGGIAIDDDTANAAASSSSSAHCDAPHAPTLYQRTSTACRPTWLASAHPPVSPSRRKSPAARGVSKSKLHFAIRSMVTDTVNMYQFVRHTHPTRAVSWLLTTQGVVRSAD